MLFNPYSLGENKKSQIVRSFEGTFTQDKRKQVRQALLKLIGTATINSFVDRVKATLSSLPQEIRLILRHDFSPLIFESLDDATTFLDQPKFIKESPYESYLYQITYSDGSEFERAVDSLKELKDLHKQIVILSKHMNRLNQ